MPTDSSAAAPVVNTIPAAELRGNVILRAHTVEEAVAFLRHHLGNPRQEKKR